MEYSEITITISCGPDGTYHVEAKGEDGSVREATLIPPFELAELAGSLFGVASTVRGTGAATREGVDELVDDDVAPADARSRGLDLFKALFQPSILESYHQTLFARGPGRGVRVRLVVGGTDPNMMKVASLPWELLLKDPLASPLALTSDHVLVRSLRAAEPVPVEDIPTPLRIMLVMSNPQGTGALDVAREGAAISARWEGVLGTELVQVPPTLNAITAALAEKQFHVLHYMGHGDFSQAKGEGALVLENGDGTRDVVDAATFAGRVKGRGLRLVFLNACKTGTTSARGTADPFGGVTAALIAAGIPAVVANQFPISDAAAITFSDAFYLSIVRGLPVDAAVSEGRRSLFRSTTAEWATPVLYMRSPNGEILRLQHAAPRESTSGASTKFKVFLAATSRPDSELRAPLAAALEAAGVEVLSVVPATDAEHDAASHADRVRALVSEADLCVHILDGSPGQELSPTNTGTSPSDESELPLNRRAIAAAPNTIPVQQFIIGTQNARSQLLIYEEPLDLKAIQDAQYRDWLEAQTKRARDANRFLVESISLVRAKESILARRDALVGRAELVAAPGEADQVLSVYVDMQMRDWELASPLLKDLGERGINTSYGSSMIADDASPAARVAAAEDELRRAQLIVLVFGSVASEFVAQRFNWLDKTLGRLDLTTPIVIYTAGQSKTDADMKFNRRRGNEIIDATRGYDAARVTAILGAL